MNKKTISAITWAFFSCVFLWLFSLTQIRNLSSPPAAGELFNSFVLFSFMLLGGGASYHFLSEIISSPYGKNNLQAWNKLSKILSLMMILMITIPLSILCCRTYLPQTYGWILSYLYSVFSMISCVFLGESSKPLFQEIRSNNELNSGPGTNTPPPVS